MTIDDRLHALARHDRLLAELRHSAALAAHLRTSERARIHALRNRIDQLLRRTLERER